MWTLLVIAAPALCVVLCGYLYYRYNERLNNNPIFSPLKQASQQVLLIIIPDKNRRARDYVQLVRAIQRESLLELWVGVVHGTTSRLIASIEINARVVTIVSKVREGGFQNIRPNVIFVAGHGEGGLIAADIVQRHNFRGLILLASHVHPSKSWLPFQGGIDIEAFAQPVLTVGGELDGIGARVTRLALAFRSYQENKENYGDNYALYKRPVVILPNVNHSQFADDRLVDHDLKADTNLRDAQIAIAETVNAFLVLNTVNVLDPSKSSPILVQTTTQQMTDVLIRRLRDSERLARPFLIALDYEVKWCQSIQVQMSNLSTYDSERIRTCNTMQGSLSTFMLQKPKMITMSLPDDAIPKLIYIQTHSYCFRESSHDALTPVSSREIAIKLKTQESISVALDKSCLEIPEERSAGNLNAQALEWALSNVSKESRERYFLRGKQLDFGPDRLVGNTVWLNESLHFQRSEYGDNRVLVSSPVMKAALNSVLPRFAGNIHAKLLSPSRAMEWVLVDSLYPDSSTSNPPSRWASFVQGFFMWVKGVKIMSEAKKALRTTDRVIYKPAPLGGNWGFYWHGFFPSNPQSAPKSALIFYPGEIVPPEAYAPLAAGIAASGYPVFVLSVPFKTSTFGIERATTIQMIFPEIKRWVVGGHAIGGLAACMFAQRHPSSCSGVLLYSAFPNEDVDLSNLDHLHVTVCYGTNETSVTKKLESPFVKAKFPSSTRLIPVAGGNKEQFGYYTGQRLDGIATISRAVQKEQAVDAAVDLLESVSL
eukprot:TRINITY_DN1158_c0_g4_i5.p1 TRINITY_DN1158_c0_g4~~TRINITY_DN1158_c0_g4_i5.p1  ORF type:complete len:768 (-),score=140.70 TRINITY_DN1158_c0_g4_i5:181-2484(-)